MLNRTPVLLLSRLILPTVAVDFPALHGSFSSPGLPQALATKAHFVRLNKIGQLQHLINLKMLIGIACTRIVYLIFLPLTTGNLGYPTGGIPNVR